MASGDVPTTFEYSYKILDLGEIAGSLYPWYPKILLRKEYEAAYDHFEARLESQPRTGIVLLGQPGIGELTCALPSTPRLTFITFFLE